VPDTSAWTWSQLYGQGSSAAPVTLSAGTHTLTIKYREDGTRLRIFQVTDDAVVRFDAEDVFDRSTSKVEVKQVGLEPRVTAHGCSNIGRDKRLSHARRCRGNPEHSPAAITLKPNELGPDEVEAARASVPAIEAMDKPSSRLAAGPAKLIALSARRTPLR
jgi:hypothetical protein